jgi:hypothetical protein
MGVTYHSFCLQFLLLLLLLLLLSHFSLCIFKASDFFFLLMDPLDIWQDSLVGGSVQRQGLYLHGTTRHKETQTHIHALSRIRTCDPNVRAAEDSTCLRLRGY